MRKNKGNIMTGMLLGDIYSKGGNRITSPAALVVPGGLEPPLTEPKTVVLPLHHRTKKLEHISSHDY